MTTYSGKEFEGATFVRASLVADPIQVLVRRPGADLRVTFAAESAAARPARDGTSRALTP